MEKASLDEVARRYRDEGYDVVVRPRGDQAPPFLAGMEVDLIATRGEEGVVVVVRPTRLALSYDVSLEYQATIINAQPGWRTDLVVLEPETPLDRAERQAAEPSDEQLSDILKTADELSDKGYVPSACLIAWAGLEAAMRLRDGAELPGRPAPDVLTLINSLYSNGLLTREQFRRIRESYDVRTQVAHGLVPPRIDPDLIRYVTATARQLVNGEGVAVP